MFRAYVLGHRATALKRGCSVQTSRYLSSGEAPSCSTPKPTRPPVDSFHPRQNWTRDEISIIFHRPLLELVFEAAALHRQLHDPSAIKLCTLTSIKTGGCTEDCAFCEQSSRYHTGLKATKLSPVDAVLDEARRARANGSTRFCMGAAWRDMRGRRSNLRAISDMVRGVRALGLEPCVLLGMVDAAQAALLAEAGLVAYNHNLETSPEFYPRVISTRSHGERLETIRAVAEAGLRVCTGGILGLGESDDDRVGLIHSVATMAAHPEMFVLNVLVPIEGTPLGDNAPVPFPTVLRTIATARLVLPASLVKLASGRVAMSDEQQALAFMAGANAVFTGEKMLTMDTSSWEDDKALFQRWGLRPA